jgi:hypothetical protein
MRMSRVVKLVIVATLAVTAAGCGGGDGLLRTQGRVLKGGEPFIPEEGEYIQITFVPIPEKGKRAKYHYWADVDQTTGLFMPSGPDHKGMPAGTYRVAVELMKQKKDLLQGKFDEELSPFVFEIDSDTSEIVIDLDDPPTG